MQQQPRSQSVRVLMVLIFWLAVLWAVFANEQRIIDWWKLRGYSPSAAVASLATADTMTDEARHLFYVNKPLITSGPAFAANCPQGSEKTVVLGCYKGGDNGIWLYDVTDMRLDGVEQVTAAHEMLHAAYARLSSSERKRVDGLLQRYYQSGLTDQRVKDTIEAYKKSEPLQLKNEMHSVFGTEVAQLPPELEQYYRRYFRNRASVTDLTAKYQAEFTSRQQQVEAYDAQLKDLKQSIEANQTALTSQSSSLQSQQARMDALRAAKQYSEYNAMVNAYNAAVANYNALLEQTKLDIAQYNDTVDKRNAIALEERQLTQALSPNSLPAAQ